MDNLLPGVRMRSIGVLAAVLLLTGLIDISAGSPVEVNPDETIHSPTRGYIGPVLILNDTAFDEAAVSMNWSGNGSSEDPYIIENLEVSANGSGYGIGISTSYNFTIRNCSIGGANGGEAPLGAISILAGNGTIEGCNISSSGYGIRSLVPARVVNNTVTHCHNGLWLISDYFFVSGNRISEGRNFAIFHSGDDSVISENTIINWTSGEYGIKTSGNRNIVRDNSVFDGKNTALYIFCQDSLIENNTMDNWDFGIHMIQSYRTRVQGNIITNIDDHGIRLESSDGNIIRDNFASNNDDGVHLISGSDQNIVVNNTIRGCEEGIYIVDGTENEFYGNSMYNCSFYFDMIRDNFATQYIPINNTIGGRPVYHVGGMDFGGWVVPAEVGQWVVWEATNLSIHYSNISGGTSGIILYNCIDIVINESFISDQTYEGILAYECHNLTVAFMEIIRCGEGINLGSTSEALIKESFFRDHQKGIILSGTRNINPTACVITNCDLGVEVSTECSGFIMNGVNFGGSFDRMVDLQGDESSIINCEFKSTNISSTGLVVGGISNCIKGNIFSGHHRGILAQGSEDTDISSNSLDNCVNGIEIKDSRINVSGNDIEEIQGGYGISDSGTDSVIRENLISDLDDTGIILQGYGSQKLYSNVLDSTSIDLFNMDPVTILSIPLNNTVDGKPIRCYRGSDLEGVEMEKDGGEYIFLDCVGGLLNDVEMDSGNLGIVLYRSDDMTFSNCSFRGHGTGIKGIYSRNARMVDSEFRELIKGIDANGDEGWKVHNCSFRNTTEGINLTSMDECDITSSLFQDVGRCISQYSTDRSDISGNLFEDNHQCILLDMTSESNRIEENGFLENHGIPIHMISGRFNRIERNAFVNNGRLLSEPSDLFIDEETTYVHNNHFWNYTGPDANNDGKVDEPYGRIPGKGNSTDMEPLVHLPHGIVGTPINFDSGQFMETIVLNWTRPTSILEHTSILGYTVRRYSAGSIIPVSWSIGPVGSFIDRDIQSGYEILYTVQARTILGEGAPIYDNAMMDLESLDLYVSPEDGGFFNNSTVVFDWHSSIPEEDISLLDVKLDEVKLPLNGTPRKFNVSVDVMGWHSLLVSIRDVRGYSANVSISFFCDWEMPEVELKPEMDWTDDMAHFSWNSSDNLELAHARYQVLNMTHLDLYDIPEIDLETQYWRYFVSDSTGSIPPPPPGPYSEVIAEDELPLSATEISLKLPEGNFSFVILVEDLSGNTAYDHIGIGVDRTVPGIRNISPTGSGHDVAVNISIGISEYLVPDSIEFNLSGTSGVWEETNGSYVLHPDETLDHFTEYRVMFKGSDRAGNTITTGWSFKTAKDPLWTTIVTGKASDDSGRALQGVTILINGTESGITDENGYFSIELGEGSYNFTLQMEGHINSTRYLEVPYASGPMDLGVLELVDGNKDERKEFPYMVLILGTSLILITIFIAISAFTRKGGPFEEE